MSRASRAAWLCWAFHPPIRKPALAILNGRVRLCPAETSPFTLYAGSPKNRNAKSRRSTSLPVIITGTQECFFWRVTTFLEALKNYLPKTHDAVETLSRHIGKSSYRTALKKAYAKLDSISVDYAILERATSESGKPRVFVIPAEIGWSDIGSWAAVFELLAKQPEDNILGGVGETLDAAGNLLWSPGKFVAAIGVHDLILVDTPDALLICPRDRAQDVGKIVKALETRGLKKLL